MKKVFVLIIVLSISLSACATKMPYELIERDGSYFVQFHDTTPSNSNSNSGMVAEPRLEFSSLRELISDFKTGNFTEEELKELRRFKKNANGEIEICSLSNLHEPILPVGAHYTVTLKGKTVGFVIDNHFAFSILNEARYKNYLEEYHGVTAFQQIGREEERNANIYEIESFVNMRVYQYTLESNGYTYHILEYYDNQETVQCAFTIIGEKDGSYFKIGSIVESARPSVEWITQFGVREYVETETQ